MAITAHSFQVSPSSGLPIFRQLIDQVHAFIAAGRLQPGDMLPSTREVARALEVNMMTVSKAYSRLEVEGVTERARGLGMRIRAPLKTQSLGERKGEFQSQVEPTLHRARQLGLTDEQILQVVTKILRGLRS